VINATFCHANPLGSRFSTPDRGAWYAAFEVATSQAEVGFHKSVQLAEIGRFEDSVTFDDYVADFSASFHDLRERTLREGPRGRTRLRSHVVGRASAGQAALRRDTRDFSAYLDPGSYVESQALAERLVAEGSLGVVYPSVRRAGGTCLACFRPALVSNVRRAKTYRFTWEGTPEFVVTEQR
jgi:RES domain